MTIAFGVAIYFVIWWIVLFAMLPIGVRTQDEEGNVTPGTVASAPHLPKLIPKMIATTVIASLIFVGVYAVVVRHVITLDDIPFLPRYDRVQ